MSNDPMLAAMDRRAAVTDRLVAALDRFDMDEAVAIVASFIDLDKLEEMVKFQENRS